MGPPDSDVCRLVGGSGEGVQEVLVADLIDREGGQSLIVSTNCF